MSKNLERDFSLKDWVTKRAANGPAEIVVEEEVALQAQVMGDTMSQKTNKKIDQVEEEAAEMGDSQDASRQQHKMTARISNGAVPAVPASPTQQIQIVRLLRDLGDRLRQSEKEREILWRELDSCRKILTDIEDKTSKTEKAFLTIESKMNARPEEEKAQADEFRKAIEDKISALETTTGSAVLRLEDAISENGKLTRRVEQITQDKARLLRKMETMEETLTQTQDALKAKALVLLTDQALAHKTGLPQTPAWNGNDTLRTQNAAAAAAGESAAPWWKTQTSFNMNKGTLASLIVLGLAVGWGLSRADLPSFSFSRPEASAPSQDSLARPNAADTAATEKDQTSLMNDIAKMANQIEPGTPAPSDAMTSGEAQELAVAAEKKAVGDFEDQAISGSPSARVKADSKLPAAVKAIETKAFAGDAEAQHDLAAIYTAGHAGVKTNYIKASEWFTEAAHNGIANAQYNLAVLYHQGLGVKQDTKKAIELYRVAAAGNHPEAQYNLGIAHIEGIGADYNPQIAAYYFQKAAAGGVVEAAYNLGLIQENGLLGEAQPDEAVFWYTLAANRGNAQASEALEQLTKQLDLSKAQVDQIFDRLSAQKPEYLKSLGVDAKAAKAAENKAVEKAVPAAKARAVSEKPVPVAAPAFDPVIVAQIQEQLIRLGLYSGSADGTSDAATQDAVKSYQSMNKLKVDGKPTEDILVHMLASEMQAEPAAGSAN